MSYGTSVTLDLPFADAVGRVRAALAEQGFGVLTEIDVSATLRARLGEQMEDYLILGACNPPAAHQARGGVSWIAASPAPAVPTFTSASGPCAAGRSR
jgi:hypothetical protein